MWSHNTPANSQDAGTYQASYIASATQGSFGRGMGAFMYATFVRMPGVDKVLVMQRD